MKINLSVLIYFYYYLNVFLFKIKLIHNVDDAPRSLSFFKIMYNKSFFLNKSKVSSLKILFFNGVEVLNQSCS